MIHKTFPITEKLLSNGLQLSRSLHQQLQEEMDTLQRKQSMDSLDNITRQKEHLINDLNQFAKQLGQVLETEQLPNNHTGINTYFEKAADAGLDVAQASETWKKITGFAIKSRMLNDQNGASIDLLMRHTRQSLNIIKGKNQTAHTYGPDGSTRSDQFSGTFFSV
ncbi:MAG: flagella synthesis protein FlgN [Gammaproteobacteria bacterium]